MPIKKSKISYKLDLKKELNGLSSKEKTAAKRSVAELVLTEIENHTQAGVSPVTGGQFKPLSKKYAKRKKKLTGSSSADLHLKDDMIEAIRAEIKANAVDFKITDRKEKLKAYNHNVGDTVKKRQFLPNDSDEKGRGVGFNKAIKEGIKEIFREINASKNQD